MIEEYKRHKKYKYLGGEEKAIMRYPLLFDAKPGDVFICTAINSCEFNGQRGFLEDSTESGSWFYGSERFMFEYVEC